MLRTSALGFLSALTLSIALAACSAPGPAAPLRSEALTSVEAQQVDALLDKLYRSFSHGEGEEPDWELMRSVFVEGAQFVTEALPGQAPRPRSVEALLADWQAAVRNSDAPAPATEERITDTRIEKVGRLIRVDVVFEAKKAGDPAPRSPGLDSLVLVETDDGWKILSFVVHHEAKLP